MDFASADEIERLLPLDDCIEAVAQALRAQAAGRVRVAPSLGLDAREGAFHVKAAIVEDGERAWFAAKCNANHPGNPARTGAPAIRGVVALFDASDGSPLLLLDSIAITRLRTASATALAARSLARRDASVAAILGCGVQGRAHLAALACVLPIVRVLAFDADPVAARRFAAEQAIAPGPVVELAADAASAVARADVVVTCTPARAALFPAAAVRPGTFVAGVGADHESKQELPPSLFARAKVVVDDLEQCARIGDLRAALAAGVVGRDAIHGTLAEVVGGTKAGRTDDVEITLFDSTGIAVEDVAAAAAVWRRRAGRHGGSSMHP
jgi:ornithine cyclodeaminase/alanine dehydrogenase-like protein (mu-crystallin family)